MAWSVLQSASHTQTSGSNTSAVTYGSNVSSGTKLIVYIAASFASNAAAPASVKDGAGNAMTLLANVSGSAHLCNTSIWAMDTPSGDVGIAPTITATWSSGTPVSSFLVQEVSGLLAGNTTAMIDGTAGTTTGTSTGSIGPPVYASTAANEYLAYVYGDDGGPLTWTVPSGYTGDAHGVNSNSSDDIQVAYKNSTGGTESGQYSISGSSAQWGLILVAFQLPATVSSVSPSPVGAQFPPSWRMRYHHKYFGPVPRQSAVLFPSSGPNQFLESLIANVAATTGTQNALAKIITALTVVAGVLSNQAQRVLMALAAATSALAAPVLRVVALAGTAAATGALQRSAGRIIQALAALPAIVQRSASRAIPGSAAVIARHSGQIGRSLGAQAAMTASMATQKFKLVILSALTAATAALTRQVAKPLSVPAAATAAIQRSIRRSFSTPIALAATLGTVKVRLLTLAANVTVAIPAVTRKILPIISAPLIIVSGTGRIIARAIQGNLSSAGQTLRAVGRQVSTSAAAIVAFSAQKLYKVAVATFVTISGNTVRKVNATEAAVIAIMASVARSVRVHIPGNFALSPVLIYGRLFSQQLIAVTSVTASVSIRAIRSAFLIIFKLGNVTVNWITGQVKKNWKIP